MSPFARKRFGQNFLVDPNILDKIHTSLKAQPTDTWIEIGPGRGALTLALLQQVQKLYAIEIDRDLAENLEKLGHPKLTLFTQDVLTFDFRTLPLTERPFKLVGNLPYNISTPLLFHLMDQLECFSELYCMVQKEVAERLYAPPKSAARGRLSVMIQYHCKVEHLIEVPSTAFRPIPKVLSSFVRLIPQAPILAAFNHAHFGECVRKAFCARRKMLRHTFTADWETIGIDPTARPETLSVEDFVKLSNHLYSLSRPTA